MRHSHYIKNLPILYYSLNNILKRMYESTKSAETNQIIHQLANSKLVDFSTQDNTLSISIELTHSTIAVMCNNTNNAFFVTNKFEFLISAQMLSQKTILHFDFFHHDLQFLIDEYDALVVNESIMSEPPTKVLSYFNNLSFSNLPESENNFYISELNSLMIWAKECNIPEDIFPQNEQKLLELQILNLSNFDLYNIPIGIQLLQNLQELYLVNNALSIFPKQVMQLRNLKKLWLQENNINYLSMESNNLNSLEELILFDNQIQDIKHLDNLPKLNFLALHRNRLSKNQIAAIKKSLDIHIEISTYHQKISLPFYVESLTRDSLAETEANIEHYYPDISRKKKFLFFASLNPQKHFSILKDNQIQTADFWIIREKTSYQILAITAIYIKIKNARQENNLEWFIFSKIFQDKNYGNALLSFSIEEAENISKDFLCISTKNIKNILFNTKKV